MVATKGRTLLIEVHSLDASGPPPSAALHAEIRAAVQRADAASGDNAVQSRMYSREARLCAVRTSHATSKAVRTAIGSIRYVQHFPVRLAVVRAFGNERLARRELAARLERAEKEARGDVAAQNALRDSLERLSELQKG